MKLEIESGRSQFYQWDTGQRLIVSNPGTCRQVHFCRRDEEMALVCPIREENGISIVDVPNILLQKAEAITAYMLVQKEAGQETRWSNHFPVHARPKPEDYVYTETETLNYAYLDQRLNKLEGEGLAGAVAEYLEKNPVQAGATAEEAQQIQQNKENIEKLTAEKLDASKLPEAVDEALTQAKASGEFDGEDGQPGIVWKGRWDENTVYHKGDAVSYNGASYVCASAGVPDGITPGEDEQDWAILAAKGEPGNDGSDYILNDTDKQEIAELAAPLVEVPDTYSKNEIDTIMGSYITDIDTLIGGDG